VHIVWGHLLDLERLQANERAQLDDDVVTLARRCSP